MVKRLLRSRGLWVMPLLLLLPGAVDAVRAKSAKPLWINHRDDELKVQLYVPARWVVRKSEGAIGFRSSANGSDWAAVGILLNAESKMRIEKAVDRQWKEKGRPTDWVRTETKVSGLRAIKIIGSVKGQPQRRMVQYYVETPQGYYIVQCVARQKDWSRYQPVFSKFIQRIRFDP